MSVTLTKVACLDEWRSFIDRNYYASETHFVSPGEGGSDGISLRSVQAGMLDISLYHGPASATFRKWHHIRTQPRETYMLWFPLNGKVTITQDRVHENTIEAGEFFISYSDRPVKAESFSSGLELFSLLYVTLPSHVMRSHISRIDHLCGHKLSCRSGPPRIGYEIFSQILAEGDSSPPDCLSMLGETALKTLSESIRGDVSKPLSRPGPQNASLKRVMRFIDQHFAVQGLTADHVARGCNMSVRALHYLLRREQTSFATCLWSTRLRQAEAWLTDREFAHFNIVDIAYMAGFRSASHFSNAYRSRFGIAPCEARKHEGVRL